MYGTAGQRNGVPGAGPYSAGPRMTPARPAAPALNKASEVFNPATTMLATACLNSAFAVSCIRANMCCQVFCQHVHTDMTIVAMDGGLRPLIVLAGQIL